MICISQESFYAGTPYISILRDERFRGRQTCQQASLCVHSDVSAGLPKTMEAEMRKYELRAKMIRRIKRFAITETIIDDMIHIGEYRYDPECDEGEPYATLVCMIGSLPAKERYELMSLMVLGRNLAFYGLNEEAAEDFCAYVDGELQEVDPRYIAGKVPLARWLRLVKKEIRPDFWSVGTRYDGTVGLREIGTEDTDFMVRLVSDQKVRKFIPGMIQDREMLVSWIQSLKPSDHEYIVMIEETGEEIGECSLTEQGSSGEIGFMLLPQFWQRGYGTEAVHCLEEKARGLGMKELTAMTDAKNKAAVRLLETTGFKKQKSGWMVMIPDEENDSVGEGQDVVQFAKTIC